MKIFIHPYIFYQGRYGGIARYVCELAMQHDLMGVDICLPIRKTENIYLNEAPFFARTSANTPAAPAWLKWAAACLPGASLRTRANRYMMRYQALQALQKGPYDIIHPSYTNSTEILPHINNTPLVVTVHDMIHELYPHAFASADPTAHRKLQFVQRADRIIAISHKTKEDLVNICGVDAAKVDVVYHGNSLLLPSDAQNRRLALPEQYLLFVGHRKGYKNFVTLLQAFAKLATQEKDLHLICVGGPEFSPEETALMNDLKVAEKVQRRLVNDDELAILYNRTRCFIYPSVYEGFGLPILEAYSCGAPVICANASCFPEIAGNAALYFSPYNVAELANAIESVIHSPLEQARLLQAGASRLTDFSWKKSAEETLHTYRKVM